MTTATVIPLFPTTSATPRSWLAVPTAAAPMPAWPMSNAPTSAAPAAAKPTPAPARRPAPTETKIDDVELSATPTIAPAAPPQPTIVIEKPHPVHAMLQAAADGLASVHAGLVEQARTEIVELALHVARHVIGEQVAWGAVDLQPLVEDALHRLDGALDVSVHVGPAHHAAIAAALSERSGVRVVLEDEYGPADLVVDSDAGSVDARLSTRVDGVERAIRSSMAASATVAGGAR